MKIVDFVIAGDTSLGDWYLRNAGRGLKTRLHAEPLSFFEKILPLLSPNATILNLETVLADNPTGRLDGKKNYLGWDSPDRTAAVLSRLGVKAVSLANNHTMDFGPEPLIATMEKLDEYGIDCFGAGKNLDEASAPYQFTLNCGGDSLTCYFIAGLKDTRFFREHYAFFAKEDSPGVNPLRFSKICAQISQLRANDPQALIVSYPHWGMNYKWATERMQRSAERMLEAGADLVLGHGAHMLQQLIATESGSGVFSLGNFIFNSGGRYKKFDVPPYSLIARIEVGSVGGKWEASLTHYPILTDNKVTNYNVRPASEAEAEGIFNVLADKHGDRSRFFDYFKLVADGRGFGIQQIAELSPRFVNMKKS